MTVKQARKKLAELPDDAILVVYEEVSVKDDDFCEVEIVGAMPHCPLVKVYADSHEIKTMSGADIALVD